MNNKLLLTFALFDKLRDLSILSFCARGLLSLFFLFSSLQAEEDSLTVKLATESPLSPLYLLKTSKEGAEFQDSYLRQLEKILQFDLDQNGSTTISQHSPEKDKIGEGADENGVGAISSWRDNHIFYVVKLRMIGKAASALALDVQKRTLINTDSFPLTGDLSHDRRQIHRIADLIHKALFGTEGIASTHILYTIKNENSPDSSQWTSEVWEADYDGGNAHQVTFEKSYCVAPIYLPPKKGFTTGAFLYVSYQLGQPKIFISTLKDNKRRRLTFMRGNQLMPAVNPQRDKVAFISDITGNPDLFLQPFSPETGAIGKPQQIFSAPQATQGSPTFSPDGKRIAFVSNKDGAPKIYVIQIPEPGTNINLIKPILISKTNRENSAPSWSPDGSKLAYCAKGKGERQIWIYDFTTKQEKQITQGPGHKENPSWAPNSLHLIFNSTGAKSTNLFIVHLNQGTPVQITNGAAEKRFPNWEPKR